MPSPHVASKQATLALYGLVCLLLAGPTACSNDDLALPGEGVPTELQILSGNNQTGTVGTLLPDSISVLVLDSKGRAVVGQRVAFVAAGTAPGTGLAPDTAVTDDAGRAVTYWQLGTIAGDQLIQAQVVLGSGTPPLRLDIRASATPGQPFRMVEAGGQNQAAQVGTALSDSLVVLIEDEFGNPVHEVAVDWVAQVGGSVSSASLPTGADGRSAVQRILGNKPGGYPTTATAAGLQGSPVRFTATGTVGPPAVLVIVTQPSSTATSGVRFARQPTVQVSDPLGNPIQQAGVDVTAGVASGAGSLGGTTTRTTNAAGVATFSDLLISGVAGVRTLIFFAPGYTSATSNSINVANTTPGSVAANAGDNQTAQVATKVSVNPSVIVRDVAGDPMQGITVTFTVTAGGGSITGASKTTDGSGIAAVSGWTLGQTVGTNTLTASVQASGVPGNPVSFTATAAPGPVSRSRSTINAQPTTLTASAGSSEAVITVVARDAFDNLIAGASVTLTATGSGNRLTQPAGPTGVNGQVTGRLSSTAAGNKTVGATIRGTTISQTAGVTVGPGPADAQQSTANVPKTGKVFQTTNITVQAIDAFGNPVGRGGDAVTVRVNGSNPATLPVVDDGNGTYRTAYTPIFPGTDLVSITVNGSPIKGSPFSSQVSP